MVRQFGLYGFVAGLCAALNILILICGDYIGFDYAFSAVVSFTACVCVGYALHCRWTFGSEPSFDGVGRYTIAMLLNLPASVFSLWILLGLAELPMTIAAPVSTVSLTVINFVLSRWAILIKAPVDCCSPERS
jgi:putative flippase GtrA